VLSIQIRAENTVQNQTGYFHISTGIVQKRHILRLRSPHSGFVRDKKNNLFEGSNVKKEQIIYSIENEKLELNRVDNVANYLELKLDYAKALAEELAVVSNDVSKFELNKASAENSELILNYANKKLLVEFTKSKKFFYERKLQNSINILESLVQKLNFDIKIVKSNYYDGMYVNKNDVIAEIERLDLFSLVLSLDKKCYEQILDKNIILHEFGFSLRGKLLENVKIVSFNPVMKRRGDNNREDLMLSMTLQVSNDLYIPSESKLDVYLTNENNIQECE